MTFEDKQELDVFISFYKNFNTDSFTLAECQNTFSNVLGEAWFDCYERMKRRGYINIGLNATNVSIGITGRKRFDNLRMQARSEKIYKGVMWVTVVAAVVGSVYAGLTYHGCNVSKPESKEKLNSIQV